MLSKRFRGHIAVGHKDVLEVGIVCQLGCLVSVFKKDGWFSVGIGNGAAVTSRAASTTCSGGNSSPTISLISPGDLRDVGVLAEETVEITACCCYGIGSAAWLKVEQGFFLHWINVSGNCPSVNQGPQTAGLVLAYSTDAPRFWSLTIQRCAQRPHRIRSSSSLS